MEKMEKIIVYIDGPNLLGAVSATLQRRVWVDPYRLSQRLIDTKTQTMSRIYYSETPYSQNVFSPEVFKRQQSFFGHLHKHIQSKQIYHIKGSYRINLEQIPQRILSGLRPDIKVVVESLKWHRPIEKGGDVGLAVRLVRGAFQNEYDHALLVTEDVDFAAAIKIVAEQKKKVSICYINNTHRNAQALRNICPEAGFVQITRKELEQCELK